RHFESMEALQAAVKAEVPRLASVLVKGSRFMKMERVVATLTDHLSPQKDTTPMANLSKPGVPACC
ncbi:MAG: hypothetical protein KA803_05335, partial [Rhodoferax sp.]|nr:hypothetical protein [Rhodoferax sp.]